MILNRLYVGLGIAGVVLAALAFAFFQGKKYEAKEWQLKMAAAEKKISELEARAPIINEKIVTEYVDRIKYVDRVKVDTRTVTEFVTVKDDQACTINNGFVQVHNAAASLQPAGAPNENSSKPSEVELSQVLNVVVENYAKYHQVSVQLESLQNWIREQKKAWEETK